MTKIMIRIDETVDAIMPDMNGYAPDPSGRTVPLKPGEYEFIDMGPWGPQVWDEPSDEDGEPTGANWIIPKDAKWTIVARKSEVVVEVNGGVAEVVSCPPGINVIIVDNDNAEIEAVD